MGKDKNFVIGFDKSGNARFLRLVANNTSVESDKICQI